MSIRLLKIVLVIFVSLQALLYGLQNLANLDEAYQLTAYVMSNAEHELYPSSMFPAISNSVLVWAALIAILFGEFTAGVLAAKGALDMWSSRKSSREEFLQSQKLAILGCGVSMIVWFGLFMVVAGAYFQMWQTAAGSASFNGAFQYFCASAVVLITLNVVDDGIS